MSLKIDRVQLEIVINNDQARKQLRELDEEARKLTKEMKGLDKTSQDYIQKSARLKSIKQQMDGIYESIGVTNMTMKELTTRQKDLNAILLHMRPGTEEYRKLKAEADAISNRIGELRGKAQSAGVSLKSMADGFNRYFGMITAFAASITGLVLGFRKIAEQVAKMDDVYSDVMKTTGKTRDEVIDLNDEFRRMDTRTAREQLNYLARDAGKLGKESKKDLLDFVEAGNQINVSLGEDLGEDAIKNIGKMVGVYEGASRQLQGLDLKGQMLAVGSAINELGASSTASEPYLVSFAGRLGGVSKQAKISIADILGYASALDQDMQQVEMSATAFQNFIMKLMADPAKFARLAGLEVKSFSNLLRTDANAAIKQVLTSMNQKGSFQDLIPLFEEMGLEGARAVGVLSSMAGSIEKVEEAQRISNQAMLEGTSITNEYNIKNNNLQASLEKARKNFLEKALALGEKLTPALIKSTNGFSYLVKLLTELPQFVKRNEVALIMLAGAFLALQAAKIKMIAATVIEHMLLQKGIGLKIKDELHLRALMVQEQYRLALIGKTTIAQKAAAIATATWRSALIALGGPLGLAILSVTGLVAAIKLYDERNAESIRLDEFKQQRLNSIAEANKRLETSYSAQSSVIKNINTLNQQQIEKLGALTAATLKQAEADLLAAKVKQQITREENTRVGLWDRIKNQFLAFNNTYVASIRNMETAKENGKKAADEFNEQISDLEQNISDLKTQHKELDDILTAEARADKIAAVTTAQYEEKARLLSVALQHVKKDSEDYVRINKKLIEVNKELSKTGNAGGSPEANAITQWQRLTDEISKAKEKLQELVLTGDMDEAMKAGELVKNLEATKKLLEEIVAAGGDLDPVIDRIRQTLSPSEVGDLNIDDLVADDLAYLDANANPQDTSLTPQKHRVEFDTEFYLDSVGIASDTAFDIWKNKADARLDYELASLDRAMQKELSNKNLTEEQKDKIRAKYDAKEKKLRTEAWKRQKIADALQAGINGALAVTRALAAPPGWPLNAPSVITVGLMGAAQVATILAQKVPQFAKGRYPVIGADDGKLYNATYTGKPETKIYSQPSLVAEQGAELIVDAPTTRNLMMNYPGIIEAIYAARVPQRAAGNLDNSTPVPVFDRDTIDAIKEFTAQLRKPVRGKWVLYDLEKSQEKLNNIRTESTF